MGGAPVIFPCDSVFNEEHYPVLAGKYLLFRRDIPYTSLFPLHRQLTFETTGTLFSYVNTDHLLSEFLFDQVHIRIYFVFEVSHI